MSEDRFDRMERQHEERAKAGQDLAGILGLARGSSEGSGDAAEKPRDEGGRFVGSVDAGEKGAAVVPKPSMGHMIMALLENDSSYLDG